MRAKGFAKINLSLHVGARTLDGYHSIRGLFQSIDWADDMQLEDADEDLFHASGRPVPDGDHNLAWRAVLAARSASGSSRRFEMRLAKSIPVAAGLGGGSADAAAALAVTGQVLRMPDADVAALAPELGADVTFCLRGGFAIVSGIGELVEPLPDAGSYAVGVVVPPVELATGAVYERWDHLGEPLGPTISSSSLPPSLRGYDALRNDLLPAADAVSGGRVEDWRSELAATWDRPVFMSGSGPSLFGLFVDVAEAEAALAEAPVGARAAKACRPSPVGWSVET